ncbi:helix-turn-helix domain-containing protein [Listeria booriae]|uniref:helix-turn-helix domain-containing protein n=1 Tax=Listeria booriae TaxID=1552123 RepID=UPI001629FFA5|nr:helix-turn-helix domain-containing protein [Listeria booriae]MBC1651594.1 helix-turn-helix domain-containing protein [Listeria booriae]
MNSANIAEVISKRRKELGLTQKQLADKIAVTDKAVSKWERGVGLPDTSLLPSIAEALDIDVQTLFTGGNQNTNRKNNSLRNYLIGLVIIFAMLLLGFIFSIITAVSNGSDILWLYNIIDVFAGIIILSIPYSLLYWFGIRFVTRR